MKEKKNIIKRVSLYQKGKNYAGCRVADLTLEKIRHPLRSFWIK